jgi:simple sugar transport system permease protein
VKGFSRDMVVMLQGFIVLFSGAMVYAIAPLVARALSGVTGWMPRGNVQAGAGGSHG